MPSLFLPILRLVQVVASWLQKTLKPKQNKRSLFWRFRVNFAIQQLLCLDFEVSNFEIETPATALDTQKPNIKPTSDETEV
jgi:hypothetical protein